MQLQIKLQKAEEITYLEENKEQTRVPPNIFRRLELRKKIRLIFQRPKDSMNGKYYGLRGYRQKDKVCLVNLQSKLEEDPIIDVFAI